MREDKTIKKKKKMKSNRSERPRFPNSDGTLPDREFSKTELCGETIKKKNNSKIKKNKKEITVYLNWRVFLIQRGEFHLNYCLQCALWEKED